MPNRFVFEENRDGADYVYYSKDLITLAGKKLHSKRNFINRFQKEYGDRYQFREIDDSKYQQVLAYHNEWCKQNDCKEDESLRGEICGQLAGLKNRQALGLKTGVLYLDGKVIAYSFGTQLSEDTFVVHIEKADHTIDGAYPMINKCFAEHHCQNVEFINREEDMGLEGLRKAKLSYHPAFILMKYCATLKEQ